MADAVIIDDGGSTRIKQLKGDDADGKMDDLISEKTDQAKGKFDSLRIVFFDADGVAHGPIDKVLNANDTFVIQSGNLQKTVGLLNGAKKLSLSLESGSPDLESIVMPSSTSISVATSSRTPARSSRSRSTGRRRSSMRGTTPSMPRASTRWSC